MHIRNASVLIFGCFAMALFTVSFEPDLKAEEKKPEPPPVREFTDSDKYVYQAWEHLDHDKIASVTVKLGAFGGFDSHVNFAAEIKDAKLLALFRQGLNHAMVPPPKAQKGGAGLGANGQLLVKTENGETYSIVFHLYPSHDDKGDPPPQGKPGMVSGFTFLSNGPSFGGLQRVYSPGWAMFLNEVFTQNNKPKLSEHAFNKLSGKYWLENSLKEAEEVLKKNVETKP